MFTDHHVTVVGGYVKVECCGKGCSRCKREKANARP
jgi:hypothetical protein